jgi:hypothetical protein
LTSSKLLISDWLIGWFMVFNTTYNNISVILWWSVLLVEKTTDLSQVTDKLYHIMLYTSPWAGFELTTVVIDTDCTGYCKSSYHAITTTLAPYIGPNVRTPLPFFSIKYKVLATFVVFVSPFLLVYEKCVVNHKCFFFLLLVRYVYTISS